MKKKVLIVLLLVLSFMASKSFSQNLADYLILEDIGVYKLEAPQKVVGGYIGGARVFEGAGPIAPTGHFYLDHLDRTYEAYYQGGKDFASPKVQVTQHAGADSDRWLLHEIEDSYRDGEMETLGLLTEGASLRKIDGNRIFWIGLGGGSFTWLSNNIVVKISYTDLQGTKPEPLEVVRAYLQKFPSTIPTAFVLDRVHDERWIKDEMERRLWLCEKWFLQLQMGKAEQQETLQSAVKHMFVFLDYREKYYGIKAGDEKILLENYLTNNDGTSIKAKLTEYKTWWKVNKGKSINLP